MGAATPFVCFRVACFIQGSSLLLCSTGWAEFTAKEEGLFAFHSKRIGVDVKLLKAIRLAENGPKGLEFGIIPTPAYRKDRGYTWKGIFRVYSSEFEKQLCWAAWTVRKNRDRWNRLSDKKKAAYGSFIAFLGSTYAPVEADDLNKNWVTNVTWYYNKL